MKNKKFAFALSLLPLISLVACNQQKEDKYKSLEIWTYYNGSTETSFQNIINQFNETKGKEEKIAVTSQSQGTNVSDLLNALLDTANGKVGTSSMPDLFLAYSDTAYELDKINKIASLDDYFTTEELSNFSEGFLNEGKIGTDGKIKILPLSKSTEALYINKTDFDKFIAKYPELNIKYSDLSTIEGLIDVSQKYYEKTGKAFYGRDSLDNYFVIGAKQLGIDILHYDSSNTYGINYDRTVFKKLWDSYYVPFVKGYFDAIGRFRSDDIKTGTVLAYVGSTSSGGYFPSKVITDEEEYAIESKVMLAPTFANGGKYAVSQGAGFCITKSSKEQESAAATFLKWLSAKDNITSFCGTSGYFPATKDGFNDDFINSETNKKFKETFQIAKETTTNYTMYSNIVGENGTNYRNTLKSSLANAAAEAKKKVEESSFDPAVIAEYTNDSKFDEWFASLQQK